MSLTGAIIFLLIGLAEVLTVQKLVYPALRWKYEEAKLTGTQGRDPAHLVRFVWLQGLVIMPLVGLFFGKAFGPWFG